MSDIIFGSLRKIVMLIILFCSTAQVSGSTSVIGNTTTIMLDANVNGTYQCSVDGGPFEPCT